MKIAIIGGGIAGLTTAIALQQIGVSCTIYESAPALKPVGAGIVLAGNALKAFEKLGLKPAILAKGRLLKTFSILDQKGKIITRTNSAAIHEKYASDNFSIHRADLHQVLRDQLPPENLHLNKVFLSFEKAGDKIILHFKDSEPEETNYLLACDGIHSVIRTSLLPQATPRFAGYTCWRAVVNMPHLTLNEATETWGITGRFGIVPLPSGKIYFFACLPTLSNNTDLKKYSIADLLDSFKNFHSPIPEVLTHALHEQLICNNICDLKPLKHFAYRNILLLGDAAHATTPNMGQGACQAIEDAVILNLEWQKGGLIEDVFRRFEKRRLERTRFISTQSRRIGQMAHLQNKFLATTRNLFMRIMPKSIKEQSIRKILDVDF